MTGERFAVVAKVATWAPVIRGHADGARLDRWLLAGVVAQESAGEQYAIRVERGFFRRYHAGLVALVARTASRHDDRWIAYPDLFSASYGLCQIMYPVALEMGATLRYPTDLLDPGLNLRLGAKKLAKHVADARAAAEVMVPFRGPADAPIRRALLRWNGGGDAGYPDKVLAWRADCVASGCFPGWT